MLSTRKLSSCTLLIESAAKQQSTRDLNLKYFINISVKGFPTNIWFQAKGSSSPDLKHVTEAEDVGSFERMLVVSLCKSPSTIGITTFVLTFSTPSLPISLCIGYLSLCDDPYIPIPLRYFIVTVRIFQDVQSAVIPITIAKIRRKMSDVSTVRDITLPSLTMMENGRSRKFSVSKHLNGCHIPRHGRLFELQVQLPPLPHFMHK